MRRIGICLWVGLWMWPCAAWAQEASVFGYCHVQVGKDTWGSPVFEHPGLHGWSRTGRPDQEGFRQAVQAKAAVPESAQVVCSYAAQRPLMEESQLEMQAAKRGAADGGQWRRVAWAPPVPASVTGSPLVADKVPAALQAMLAADPYFAAPKGDGSAVERVHEHSVGSGSDAAILTQRTRAQYDGNVCAVSQHWTMRQGELAYNIDGTGYSWAGLVPLTSASRTSNDQGAEDSRQLTLSLRHEGDALFPLRQGAHSILTMEAQTRDETEEVRSRDLRFDCTVGATVPASTVIAGTTGEATELSCRNSSPSAPAMPAQDVMFHWFADAGCFVNAPVAL